MLRRLIMLVLVLVLVLSVAAGCSGDEGEAASTSTSPTTPTSSSVSDVAETDTASSASPAPEDRPSIRDLRYCEILLVIDGGGEPTAEVWGTQGVNPCPADLWEAIDPAEVQDEYGAIGVKMNGPRHLVVDGGSGALPDESHRFYGDLEMQLLATVAIGDVIGSSGDASSAPYKEITVMRSNAWNFYAGSEIYELTDPEGVRYVMQAYSQIVDPELSEGDLSSLGERLDLPAGWTFEARVLDEDLDLIADGEATVIQDELENTYQRR